MDEELEKLVRAELDSLETAASGPMDHVAEQLVERWSEFPVTKDLKVVATKLAAIELLSNTLVEMAVQTGGSHVDAVALYNKKFREKFGHHLCAERIEKLPGLSKEVRDMLISIATVGVGEFILEQGPRYDLRLKMDPQVADEFGRQALDKFIKHGRMGQGLRNLQGGHGALEARGA